MVLEGEAVDGEPIQVREDGVCRERLWMVGDQFRLEKMVFVG